MYSLACGNCPCSLSGVYSIFLYNKKKIFFFVLLEVSLRFLFSGGTSVGNDIPVCCS